MSSSICPHFTQNAWKKDLCSNCFKSKDEHKQQATTGGSLVSKYSLLSRSTKHNSSSGSHGESDNRKTDFPNKHKQPAKSIIKKPLPSKSSKTKPHKVAFCKSLSEVIGYGGEWSDLDSDDDDDHDFMNLGNEHDDNAATSTDDEETIELKRITRANTDFNMNNGNLLGDAQENIKKSFAALKLGAPQVDKEGKKQTLLINVVPFGAPAGQQDSTKQAVKAKFETKVETETKGESVCVKQSTTTALLRSMQKSNPAGTTTTTTTTKSMTSYTVSSAITADAANSSDSDGKNSPPIERAMEKSLLDEISETLEKKQHESKKLIKEQTGSSSTVASAASKIKFEITSLSETQDGKPFLDFKKPISRNVPITKDHTKPKVNVVAHKYSDSDSNCSDAETNSVSAYYDVVETQVSYENLPDGKCQPKEKPNSGGSGNGNGVANAAATQDQADKSIYSSSQYITDMLLSSKTRAASYNLHEGNFMTSKITSDGLIVTKCSSDDALDSTGSSFDGSSDEETSYNMTRSESDSGIGISIGSDYKNINVAAEKERERVRLEKKLSVSTNNSDYEDIQVTDQRPVTAITAKTVVVKKSTAFSLEKCRELHGEPDGSADPDGSLENKSTTNVQQLPALPKSPPPTKLIDARPSFLHGLQKQHPPVLLKKPDLPAKPSVVSPVGSPLKSFIGKRPVNNVEQQVINQLQLVMSKSNENLNLSAADSAAKQDDAKLKKGRAPNPPPELKSSAPPTPERDYNVLVEFEQHQQQHQQQPQQTKNEASANKSDTESTSHSKESQAQTSTVDDLQKSSLRVATEAAKTFESTTTSANESIAKSVSSVNAAAANSANLYARKPPTVMSAVSNGTKNNASPVIREKDKRERERVTINPKFRSLNTFVTQRNNAAKNLQLQNASPALGQKHALTPEPTPRSYAHANINKNPSSSSKPLSMSDESLSSVTGNAGDKKSAVAAVAALPSPTQKSKTKFSIKKFLRMGASKTTDNLHKKDGIYSEICTGDEAGVTGKPRLVIIHPIDINPTAVEVVKDITKTNDAVAAQTVAVVTAKPPAPPLRATDAINNNKPARPPPPKSAELRRKQKIDLTASISADATDAGGSIKSKADNVYANLGEIRSSIAPRKPERTASMREREAQLELARKRHAGSTRNENADTISICSSNGDHVSAEQRSINSNGANSITTTTTATSINNNNNKSNSNNTNFPISPQLSGSGRATTPSIDGKPPTGSRTSTFERKKSDPKITISSKLEIFEQRQTGNVNLNTSGIESRPSSLKDSVRKINNTIEGYLKDKRDYENMYEFVKSPSSPPPPPARSVDLTVGQRLLPPRRNNNNNGSNSNNLYSDTASIASYTRSEYGPVRNYGLNSSLANIPRVISASYCGSEVGEFDIYAPYSYYGSEAGGDVATDINDSVWGIPSAIKNRTKATNRLRMRKGRSVVHKNIEDNYTAVVVANHEALAQVLDQLQQSPVIPPALRPLANAINLRFEDFTILDGAQAFVVGKKAFHAAVWTTAPVTLALSADCNQLSGVGGELNQLSGGISGVLNPITEFCDLVPSYHLPLMPSTEVTLLQATISVLPRLQLDTLQSIGVILKGKSQVLDKSNFNFRGSIPNLAGLKDSVLSTSNMALRNVVSVQNLSTLNEETSLERSSCQGDTENATSTNTSGMPAFDDVMTREVAFIMLQLVNGMKNLQAKAIEEMPLSLSNVVLSKDVENKDAQARLCVLQGNNNNNNDEDESMGTLCKCAHIALTEMLPTTKITSILADILQQERAESLSKAKSVLEFVLWGPSDVVLSGSVKERELALQRWLDLERATVLHGLVRTRVELTVYDECHLMFLVRSTAKMMNDAAKIVCAYQQQSTAVAEAEQHD